MGTKLLVHQKPPVKAPSQSETCTSAMSIFSSVIQKFKLIIPKIQSIIPYSSETITKIHSQFSQQAF